MEQSGYSAIDEAFKSLESDEDNSLPLCDTLFFCPTCQEEYHLPHNIKACPICLSKELEEL